MVVAPNGVRGGAQLVLQRLLSAAAARGWTIHCLCPPGPLGEDLARPGISTATIPDLSLPSGARLVGLARLGVRSLIVARAVRRASVGADGILLNGLLGLPAIVLARSGLPVIYLVHDVIRRRDRVWLLRALGWCVTTAIAVSSAVGDALADAGLDAVVVPNGTPWPVSPSSPAPLSPPVVGCAAALTVGKGQNVLIEALSMWQRPGVVVELLGEALPKDGAYASALRAQTRACGLDQRVRFGGHVSNPIDQIRGWTVAVIPSIEPEAQSLSMLEAMSVGVPVVATDNGGMPETLGDAGLLVPPDDPSALANALERLIADDDLRRRCAVAGPVRVAKYYALNERIAELLGVVSAAVKYERPTQW